MGCKTWVTDRNQVVIPDEGVEIRRAWGDTETDAVEGRSEMARSYTLMDDVYWLLGAVGRQKASLFIGNKGAGPREEDIRRRVWCDLGDICIGGGWCQSADV